MSSKLVAYQFFSGVMCGWILQLSLLASCNRLQCLCTNTFAELCANGWSVNDKWGTKLHIIIGPENFNIGALSFPLTWIIWLPKLFFYPKDEIKLRRTCHGPLNLVFHILFAIVAGTSMWVSSLVCIYSRQLAGPARAAPTVSPLLQLCGDAMAAEIQCAMPAGYTINYIT